MYYNMCGKFEREKLYFNLNLNHYLFICIYVFYLKTLTFSDLLLKYFL